MVGHRPVGRGRSQADGVHFQDQEPHGPYGKTVKVSLPQVSGKGNVDLGAKSFTIKRGKKTVAKNKSSAKLKAGTYKVTTKVRYRTWTMVTKTRTEQETFVTLSAYTPVLANCVVDEATAVENAIGFNVTLSCTSDRVPSPQIVTGFASGDEVEGWSILPTYTYEPAVPVLAAPLVGQNFSASIYFLSDFTETRTVKTSYQVRKWSATKTASRTQSLKIKQGKRPGRTDPISAWKCPKWAPIKGNASSMIYHLPGQAFYTRTKPEDCFSTQHAAKKAGYRKSKV